MPASTRRITAERFASAPPVVKFALVVGGQAESGRPATAACAARSRSPPARCARSPAAGCTSATSVSATTDATVTLGLKRPKYRGCVTCTCQRRIIRFDVGDDIVERQRREVVARLEMRANLVRRHVRHDGAARDVALDGARDAADVVDDHGWNGKPRKLAVTDLAD